MSDLEKKKCRSEMGGGVAKVMDKTESWCWGLWGQGRGEGAAGVRDCQLRLWQPLEEPSSCGSESLAMTEQP